MKKKLFLIIACLLILNSTYCCAETMRTKDGKEIKAKIVDVTRNTIWYEVSGGKSGISRTTISEILNDDGTVSSYSPDYKEPEPIIVESEPAAEEIAKVLIEEPKPSFNQDPEPILNAETEPIVETIVDKEVRPVPEPIDEEVLFKSRLIAALEGSVLKLSDLEKQYKNTRFEDDTAFTKYLKSFSEARKEDSEKSLLVAASDLYGFAQKFPNDSLEETTYKVLEEKIDIFEIKPEILSMPYKDIATWSQGVLFYDSKVWTALIDEYLEFKDRLDDTKYKKVLTEDIYPMLATAYVKLLESDKAYQLAKEGLDRFPDDKAFQKRMEDIVTEIEIEKGNIVSVVFKILLGLGLRVIISALILFVGAKIMGIDATIKDMLMISFFTSLAALLPLPGIFGLMLRYGIFLGLVCKFTSADIDEAWMLALAVIGIQFLIMTFFLIRM